VIGGGPPRVPAGASRRTGDRTGRAAGAVRALFPLLFGLLALPALSLPSAAAISVEGRAAIEHHRRSWETHQGDHRADQTVVPLDAVLRIDGSTRISLGCDLGWSGLRDRLGSSHLGAPRELRAAADRALFDGRLRLGAGARLALDDDGLSPGERRLAEALAEIALGWPAPVTTAGTRVTTQAAGQIVRRENWLLHAGLAREWRGEQTLTDAGITLDPGGLTRLAAGAVAAWGGWRQESALQLEFADESKLANGDAFEAGTQGSWRAGAQRTLGAGRIALAAAFLARSSGSAAAGALLEPAWLRGGNALRGRVEWTPRTGPGETSLILGAAAVRGFYGDLGHAQWGEAGVAWDRPFGADGVRLGTLGQIGTCRRGRPLAGFSAVLSWTGGWR